MLLQISLIQHRFIILQICAIRLTLEFCSISLKNWKPELESSVMIWVVCILRNKLPGTTIQNHTALITPDSDAAWGTVLVIVPCQIDQRRFSCGDCARDHQKIALKCKFLDAAIVPYFNLMAAFHAKGLQTIFPCVIHIMSYYTIIEDPYRKFPLSKFHHMAEVDRNILHFTDFQQPFRAIVAADRD